MESENSDRSSVFRILDAAINRAGEGMRVVEDYVRMVVEDEHLSRQLKQLRHDLTQSVASIEPQSRIAARDTIGDVGCQIETESEYQRGSTSDGGTQTKGGSGGEGGASNPASGLVQANLARAQQALRTIEEFSKTIDPEIAKRVEQLRYRTYTVEKAVLTTVVSLKNFSGENLYVLVDGCGWAADGDANLITLTRQLIEAEVDVIQLRDKTLNDRQLVDAGRAIAALVRGTSTRFIMNDRADLAVAAGANGVHLGQDDLEVADARRIVGAARIIGVSTHSISQARQAVLDGANYIGVGPVFESTTKNFSEHVGLELIDEVVKEIQLPAFAIGGINLENVSQIADAGLSRVALSAAVTKAVDPKAAAIKLKQKLRN